MSSIHCHVDFYKLKQLKMLIPLVCPNILIQSFFLHFRHLERPFRIITILYSLYYALFGWVISLIQKGVLQWEYDGFNSIMVMH